MIVLDIEASGLDPKKHSIVSIGAVDFSNPENLFYEECRIWDGAEINPQALEVCGFSREEITDPNKQSHEQMIRKFVEWYTKIEDKTIAGQNPCSLDIPILQHSLYMYGFDIYLGHRSVDLHSVCYGLFVKNGLEVPMENSRSRLNLDNILLALGMPEEPHPHNALNGAKLEAEAFSRLLYGKPFFDEYKIFKSPEKMLNL